MAVVRDRIYPQAFVRGQGLALGRAVANRLSLKLGQRITVQGDVYPVDLELIVRAIYEGPDDIEAYFHWKYLQESLPPSYKGLVTTFSVRARTPQDVSRIAQAPTRNSLVGERASFLLIQAAERL